MSRATRHALPPPRSLHVSHRPRPVPRRRRRLLVQVVGRAGQGPAAPEAPVQLGLATVETGPAPDRLTLTGMVAAEESSDVAASVPGRVVAVLVERGAKVKFGDPLVRLDASSAALSAQSVKAQLGAAQAQERLAAEECKRAQALLDKGAITRSQYDREITSCTAAAQTVAATKAQLGLVSKSIADGVVRAPFAGRVDGRWVSPGEYVAPGMRLVTLVDDDPLKVELAIPEAYVPRIAVDQAGRRSRRWRSPASGSRPRSRGSAPRSGGCRGP
jgi:membrane fusion protein (multidrug efflux system)